MKSRLSLILSLLKKGVEPNAILVRLAFRESLLGCESVLDVGCGSSGQLRLLGAANTTGFEGYQPDFEEARHRNTHDHLVHGDARELSKYFQPRQFDACIALDVIEHFTKEDGLKLMRNMERIARKKVIFFTPKGFLPQRQAANDDLQQHLSGWEPSEMKSYGYDVIGLLGPKNLRGEGHVLKRKPASFWAMMSLIGQLAWTRCHPDSAAAILCVKHLKGS